MIPAFLKMLRFSSVPQPRTYPRFSNSYFCGACDSVQPGTGTGRCVACGAVLLSLVRLLRQQEERIAALTARVQELAPLEYLVALKHRGTVRGYDPVMLLPKTKGKGSAHGS